LVTSKNILYFIPGLTRSYGGIFQYTFTILQMLKDMDRVKIYVFSEQVLPELDQLSSECDNIYRIPINECLDQGLAFQVNRVKRKLNEVIFGTDGSKGFKLNFAVNKAIRKYNIDLVHTPFELMPIQKDVPVLATIHDLQERHFPEYFNAAELAKRAMIKQDIANRSAGIVCSFEHVKKDIVGILGASEENVHVCLPSMEGLWFKDYKGTDLKPMNFAKPFILYPAATWKHKNHVCLLKAVARSMEEHAQDFKLICTGALTPYYKEIQSLMLELELGDDQVEFRGVVSEEELFSLYMHCQAVVVPTKYEAGSFPLIESIFLERPVICSDVTSLPETIGDTRFTFDPDDVQALADLIHVLMTDADYLKAAVENSKSMQERLRAPGTAEKIKEIYFNLSCWAD